MNRNQTIVFSSFSVFDRIFDTCCVKYAFFITLKFSIILFIFTKSKNVLNIIEVPRKFDIKLTKLHIIEKKSNTA